MRNILILLLLGLHTISFATNYYVSNRGNDAANGRSPSTAWRTMANVNSRSFNPGDSILFERGGTWNENLRITSSGSPAAQITYGAYGTGNRPVITGMREVPGWDVAGNWTYLGDNNWSMEWTSTRPRLRIWINFEEKQRSGFIEVTKADPWQWYNDTFYLYSEGNPATTYTSVKAASFEPFLAWPYPTDKNYITFENLEINGFHTVQLYGCSYWIIQNCILGKYFTGDGIRILGDGDNYSMGGVLRNNILDSYDRLPRTYVDLSDLDLSSRTYNTDDGIRTMEGVLNWDINDNYIRGWGHTCVSIEGGGPSEGIRVFNNYITNVGMSYGRGLGGGLIIENANPANPVEFFNNIIEDQGLQSQIIIPYTKIYNNIWNRTRGRDNDPTQGAHALWISGAFGQPQFMEIYNNVFANNNGHGIEFRHSSERHPTAHNFIANNIFYNNLGYNTWAGEGSGIQLQIDAGAEVIHDNTFTNNLFYSSETRNTVRVYHNIMTVEEFNTLDGSGNQRHITAGNITGDPLFVNPDGNFRLLEGSPAIGAGINPLSDYDHDNIVWKSPPSIGAYEYPNNPNDPPEPFTVRIYTEGNGSVEVNGITDVKTITAEKGERINLAAIAKDDWQFNEWDDDLKSTNSEVSLIIQKNLKITARFGKIPTSQYPLSIDPGIERMQESKKKTIIYPNPAQDYFTISAEDLSEEPELVRIIDFHGKIVYENLLDPGSTIVQIPGFLNTGIYIVELLLRGLPLYAQRLVITK